MTKKRVVGSAVLSLTLGLSVFTGSTFAQGVEAKNAKGLEEYRVLIEGTNTEKQKVKAQHKARWDFSGEGFTTTVNAKQYEALLKNKNLKVTKVEQVQLDTPSEVGPIKALATYPSTQAPWGIKAIYNDSTVQKTSGGSGINVAVLDTGVNINHIDLQGQAEQCKDFTQTSSQIVNNTCTDRNGHGTHVAGTVLANGGSDGAGIYGVAPDSDLWAYKVLTDSGSGYSDDIAAAIRHAADEATRTGTKTVINMSLGSSGKDSLISSAVDYAYSKGVLVVAAAGNDGYGANTIGYPGALTKAVAVAALENVQESGTYRVANFSSRGNPSTDGDFFIQERDVELSAPGAGIESTWFDGNYKTISGTSMATPHVAGLAAKIWASSPSLSHTQLRTELQNRAKTVDIKGGYGAATGDDYASGFGFPRVK
ncbi:S8 family peptidase [Metabacillus iocasae]|uniref:Subtilisin n=1 Tax=Priestia iocasae TaxID=2291674 RepID=A0ABS2QSE4_9BACI|nr:S8 family serine peptidase [Metabacillus iocasae]MBM7702386.1 subtilisin [Metabacillus iocasae]